MPRIIVQIPGEDPHKFAIELDRQSVSIGRDRENDIVISSGSVSGYHAEIERVNGGFIIRDLESTNGITADGVKMDIVSLRDGQRIKFADITLHYTLNEEEIVELAKEPFKNMDKRSPASLKAGASNSRRRSGKSRTSSDSGLMTTPEDSADSEFLRRRDLAAASHEGISFSFFFLTFMLCLGALFFGFKNGYEEAEKTRGRENPSLVEDLQHGRPPMTSLTSGSKR